MDFQKFNYDEEIVLTYRPDHQAEEVVLRYERPLPHYLQPAYVPPAAAPMLMPAPGAMLPPLNGSTAPQAKKKRSAWKVILIIVLCASIAIGSIGVGAWCLISAVKNLPGIGQDFVIPSIPNWDDDEIIPGWDDDDWYDDDRDSGDNYTDGSTDASGAPNIDSFRPTGSIPRLELVSVAKSRKPLTPVEIYKRVAPATVTVLGSFGETYSVGTGVIFTSNGYIVTNYHVIAGCQECTVWVKDENGADTTYDAKFVGGDEQKDLAVLKIDATGLPTAEFGVSADLQVGDSVYAIGNPLGTELRSTFTDGIVSAVDRNVEVDGVTMTLVQTNAALNHGNSGGPLINIYGQVIGINTIKMMSGEDTIEGLGFAIPTSHAVRWINEILSQGYVGPSPILGLSVSTIPERLPDGTMGLEVVEIVNGLSAYKAGVQVGDYVVGFNGAEIRSTDDIYAERIKLSVGDVVTIRVYRNGEYLDLTMTMMAPLD